MNGKRGDHPLIDILIHHHSFFSSSIDSLIVEIAKYVSYDELCNMFDWLSPPPFEEFEEQLKNSLHKLKVEAKEKGWEQR